MNTTKKILLAVLIAVMSVGIADAQFRFGIKAGLNVNNLHVKDFAANLDKDNGCGWTAGVMTEFQVPLIGLCFDLSAMYTRMNAEPEYTGTDLNALSYNKNFIEVPLNIKYKFGLPVVGRFLSPYIFTGPAFAFKLDKNIANTIKTKTCQVAWNVGLGVELVHHLQIGASYGFGINNIVEKVATQYINTENTKLKNNYWTITAAYLF